MLNEAFQITNALERAGVVPEAMSPLFEPNSRKPGLCVSIAKDGSLNAIRPLDGETVGGLGRYKKDNGKTFPSINLGPLRKLSADHEALLKKTLKGRRTGAEILAAIKLAYSSSVSGLTPDNVANLQKCLRLIPADTAPYWEDATAPYSGISILIQAFKKRHWTGEEFAAELERLLLRSLDAQPNDLELLRCACQILFEKKCPVLWESAEIPLGEHAVCSQDMRRFLNRRLVERTAPKTGAQRTEALTGLPIYPTDKYPKVPLPVVGPSYFFSSPEGNYCQSRYGLNEGSIFPTSQDTADKLNSAVTWLVAPEREGLTWDKLPHDGGGVPCLLIAYVAQQPVQQAHLARLFGNSADPIKAADRFETQCKTVLDLLDADLPAGSGASIELLVIAKPDPGRRNIVFSDTFSVDALRAASTRWNAAQLAAPPFRIRLPAGKGEDAIEQSSFVLHPARLLVLLNTAWVRGVAENVHVSGTRFHEVFRLFLGHETAAKRQATDLLPRALKHWTNACHVIAQERRHGALPTALPPDVRKFARQAVSALTLLLHYLERPASLFMNESAYHLGRALAYANKLHELYCKHQRAGSIPTGLLGSALIATAATQPVSALARLLERMPPYENWAATTLAKGSNPEAPLIGWARSGLRESLQRVPREALGKRFTDTDRAELLLGYMSDLSSSKS